MRRTVHLWQKTFNSSNRWSRWSRWNFPSNRGRSSRDKPWWTIHTMQVLVELIRAGIHMGLAASKELVSTTTSRIEVVLSISKMWGQVQRDSRITLRVSLRRNLCQKMDHRIKMMLLSYSMKWWARESRSSRSEDELKFTLNQPPEMILKKILTNEWLDPRTAWYASIQLYYVIFLLKNLVK